MGQYLAFAVVGLGFGCIYAAIATGVVITYRGTGIINFATGAMAMWGAYVYDELERTGDLLLPVAGIPHRINLPGDNVPMLVSYVIAVASCALVGLMANYLVFRPLRRAPILAKVVASVGVLLAIQALVVMQFRSEPRNVPPILPNEPLTLLDVSVPQDRLWITGVVLVAAVALWAYFRYSRVGLATRASAENERAVSLARYSPQALAGTTWLLSSTVVGAIIILTAPTVILNPLTHVLAIVPALAAALIGRLSSIAVTVGAALGLGAFQSIVTLQTTKTWWPGWAPPAALNYALPFVVIVIALFLVGNSLPSRGAVESDPLPDVMRPQMRTWVVALVVVLGVASLLVTSGRDRFGVITSLAIVVIMLSLVVLTGMVGQISLAQAGIAGTAGFALSKLASDLSIPFPISTLLAALLAAGFGVLIGIPALRIRGAQLAVVTMAGAVTLEQFIFRNPSLTQIAGNPIPDATLFGVDLGVREGRTIARLPFGILVLVVVVLCCLLVGNLARSATGRRFLAVRSNERAGAAVGISVASTKLVAFGVASFLAGIGGALIGYSRGQLSADSFTTLIGLSFLAFAYLGGITSIPGAIIAATFAPLGIGFVLVDKGIDRWLDVELGPGYQLLGGIALVVTAIFNPQGIAGANHKNWLAIKAWFKARRVAAGGDDPDADAATDADSLTDEAPDAVGDVPLPAALPGEAPTVAAAVAGPPATPPVPALTDGETVLATTGVSVSYGGLRAVDAVDLEVRAGQIVGLIGPNGAGKTTFIDALTGFTPCEGQINFAGQQFDVQRPHERARLGLARTWQSLELFGDLTVRENAQVASERATASGTLRDLLTPNRAAADANVDWALELMGLEQLAEEHPRNLPLGQQKLLGVARALASAPKLVLLDEPAAGLDTAESTAFGRRMNDVVSHGTAILLVDHDMGLVLDVCHFIYVLDFGKVIATGTPDEVRANERVVEAYLGQGQVA